MGGDDALIDGQGRGGVDGVDALVDDVRRAHMVVAEEGLKGRAARELGSFESGPAAEEVAKKERVFVLKPLQRMREIVFQGAREPIGKPHFVADHAATMFDELCEGTHGGALRIERPQLVSMGQQQFELKFGIGGVVFGPTGCKGFAIPRQRQWIEGEEDQKVILVQGEDQGAFLSSRQTATGWPLNRVRSVMTHASMASGV